MNCEIFREMIGSYVDETLEEDRRRWFRDHLRECGACRDVAVRKEPSLFFAVAPSPVSDLAAIEDCVAAVTSRIRQDRFERRLRRNRRPWMAAAAAAAMVIGSGLMWRAFTGDDGLKPGPTIEASRDAGSQATPPTVEVEVPGEEVRVYQFATDGDDDTAVYFIVDPALEL